MKKSRSNAARRCKPAGHPQPEAHFVWSKEEFAAVLHERLYMLIHQPDVIRPELEKEKQDYIRSYDWTDDTKSDLSLVERRQFQEKLKTMTIGDFAMFLVETYTWMLVNLEDMEDRMRADSASGKVSDFETFMALGMRVEATA